MAQFVFVFRTNILENDEEKGNVFVDILSKNSIDAIAGIKHKNTFIHCLSDTNFERHRKPINELIEFGHKICVALKEQQYYRRFPRELCKLNEIQYILFEKYTNELINSTCLKIESIFMKQLDILRYKKAYEELARREAANLKRSSEAQKAIQKEKEYYYDKYRHAELEWSRDLLQFKYIPSKEIQMLRYKASI